MENSDDYFITIKLSTKLYAGFEYKIPKDIFNKMTTQEIISEFKTYMKNFFSYPHNLYMLKKDIDKLDLHIHDDIPHNRAVIYLCNSTHGRE